MDRQIATDLYSFNTDFNQIVDQCVLMCDKIAMYKDDPSFDAHIKDHFFLLDGTLDLLDNVELGSYD